MKELAKDQGLAGWHFPRRQVADSYLRTLSSGVMLSTTVYAPPSTGLSHFLINDVVACAQEEKYVTVYVDLSDPQVPVTAAVLAGLERVLSGSSVLQSGFNFLKGIFQSKLAQECKVHNYQKKIEIIDNNYFIDNKVSHIALIESYFQKLLNYKSVLILIDHAHGLNKDELGQEFCAYFRSLISQHSSAIRPLYATNNMASWSGVFENRRSSLYSEGAFVHKLPALGKVFVREVIQRMGWPVSMEEAVKCFDLTDGRPGVFLATLAGWRPDCGVPLSTYFVEQTAGLNPPDSLAVKPPAEREKINVNA